MCGAMCGWCWLGARMRRRSVSGCCGGLRSLVWVIGWSCREWISEERKRALFADALACAYVPLYDEDSYGYVSLEPLAQAGDCVLRLGGDVGGRGGWPHWAGGEPEPEALAAAMDGLQRDPGLARRMGEAGYERLQAMNISWDHVIDRLLA